MEETQKPTPTPMQEANSRKWIILAIGIVIILLGTGGYYVMRQQGAKTRNAPVAMTISPTKSQGMFGSIKEALSKSLSLRCEYSENGKKTTAYLKAGAVRADMSGGTAQENGSVIVKEEKMYFWNGKQGMMMAFDIDAMTQEEDEVTPNVSTSSAGDVLVGLEKFKEHCKPAAVSDTLFIPPTDVKFVDQTKMMQSLQQRQKEVTPGQAMNEEQMKLIQENMKKYQQDVPQN